MNPLEIHTYQDATGDRTLKLPTTGVLQGGLPGQRTVRYCIQGVGMSRGAANISSVAHTR